MEVFIRDEEFNKLVDNAEWIPDCQDKWNLDFNILSVDTRMWGNQGGMLCFGDGKFEEIKEEKASAKTTITFGEQVILESPYIYGKNNDECKQNVKDWLKLNYKNIFKNFIEQHDTEVKKPLKDEIIRLKNYVIDINKNNNILREQLEKTCRNTFDPTKWKEEGYQKIIEELKKWIKKYPQVQEWDSIYNIVRTYIHKEDLEQKLIELKEGIK